MDVQIIYTSRTGNTEKLAEAKPGDCFSLLTGLGNGYDTAKC